MIRVREGLPTTRELMTTTAFLGPDPGGPVVDGRRTRGNELVIWIDDEKRRDLFTELQMCHDHGSYANSAGVASDPKNRSTQDLSGFWFRPCVQASGNDSTRRLPR